MCRTKQMPAATETPMVTSARTKVRRTGVLRETGFCKSVWDDGAFEQNCRWDKKNLPRCFLLPSLLVVRVLPSLLKKDESAPSFMLGGKTVSRVAKKGIVTSWSCVVLCCVVLQLLGVASQSK